MGTSVSNLFTRAGLVWRPDANTINAPEGSLLRADNMVPDEDGSLSVRRGTRVLYSFPAGTEDIRVLYTWMCRDGYTYRMMQADSQVYIDPHAANHTAHWEIRHAEADSLTAYIQFNYTGGSWEKDYASSGDVGPVGFTAVWEGPGTDNYDYIDALVTTLEPVNWNTTFAGTGDIAFGDDHQQCFMARSTSTKKFDGHSFMEWGIAKPSAAATLSAVAPKSTDLITCATGEAGVIYGPLYSQTLTSTTQVEAKREFVDDQDDVASQASRITPGRIWDINYGFLTRGLGTDTDLFNIDGNVGSDQDIFEVWVKIEDPKHVKEISLRVDCGEIGDTTSDYYRAKFYPKQPIQSVVRDSEADGANAYEEKVVGSLDPIEPKDKPRVQTPEQVKNKVNAVGDSKTPSISDGTPPINEWFRIATTRNQFVRTGTTNGRDWETCTQVNIEFITDDGFTPAISFSDWVVYSAGAGTLSGTYKVVYRWVRDTDRYYETSPPSDESEEILLYGNQLRVTVPANTQNAADDQVTDVWVYIFGGFLDTYYRAATATADPQKTATLVVDVEKNEIQILTENEKLEPYIDEPRDNIIAIAGPWNGRLFTLTNEGYVYPSLQTSPSTFNTYQVIDLSNQGDPLWMVKTSSGIHCGCEKDVVFMAGTGDEDVDRVTIDLYPHPLNIGTPPFDTAVFVDGNSILYRSTDGLVMLASQGLTHVPDEGIRLLWRGQTRHGVSGLNVLTGRFRMTVDNKMLYVLVAEGATTEGSTVVYRLDMNGGQWSRLIYPNSLLSIINEPDGTLIAGTNDGKLLELEYSTGDTGANPSVTIWTPYTDGGNPLARKDAFDLQFHANTNSNTATVAVHKDGATAATSTYTFSTSQAQVYRIQSSDVGAFIRAQFRVTGTFDQFILSSFDLTYRVRPQHMNYLDTGYLIAEEPGDMVWLQEIEIDANTPSNLYALVYLDDQLYTTQTVTVTANVRTVYRVPLPRGTKSRRPRIVVKTSASDGAGEVGFDPYFVRVRTRSSGNASSNQFRTVWPVGEAP